MYDYMFRSALVADGSGGKPFRANVAVFGDSIAFIGNEEITRSKEVIDASGCILVPGFIDIHTHTDLEVLRNRDMAARISQGITTDVSGNCGVGVFPNSGEALRSAVMDVLGVWDDWNWTDYPSYRARLMDGGIGINEAFLVSHTALRLEALGGNAGREASDSEIDAMCASLDKLLDEGAWGFSTGLYYAPCVFASRKELLSLFSVVRRHSAICAVHHRCEGNDVISSLDEVISLARETGARLEISHLKAIGNANQKKVPQLLSMIEKAREEGVDVKFDQYPYSYGSTSLFSLLPPDILSLSRFEQRIALSLDNEREEIRNEILHPDGWDSIYEMVGPDDITAMYLEDHPDLSGKTLSEIGKIRGCDPLDALFDILSEETGLAVMTDVTESEENLHLIMKHPLASFGTDSLYSSPVPHPRSYHSTVEYLFAAVKGGLLPLESAVRRMTGENADRMGFKDRGYIREGYKADIVLLDPEKLGTDGKGNRGFRMVMVNGVPSLSDDRVLGARAGRVL